MKRQKAEAGVWLFAGALCCLLAVTMLLNMAQTGDKSLSMRLLFGLVLATSVGNFWVARRSWPRDPRVHRVRRRNLTQRLHAGKRTFSKTIQQQRVQKALFRAHLRRPEMRERIALARTNATISQLMSHLEGCCRCARCRGCGRRRHREGLFTAFRRVMTKR